MQECYICLELTSDMSPCDCKSFLCINCLEKLRIYEYYQCTVCKKTMFILQQEEEQIQEKLPILLYLIPYCCRSKKYKQTKYKRYYCCEFVFHLFFFCCFSIFTSCMIFQNDQCYYPTSVVNIIFPCIIIYFAIVFFANSLCK